MQKSLSSSKQAQIMLAIIAVSGLLAATIVFADNATTSVTVGNSAPVISNVSLNLNSSIKVKVTDKGYELLAQNHNELIDHIPNWEHRTPEYYKNKADENGYTSFQAWVFMNEFSMTYRLGFEGYYDTNILIDEDNLKAY